MFVISLRGFVDKDRRVFSGASIGAATEGTEARPRDGLLSLHVKLN